MSGIIVGAMTAKLTASLRAAPATLPALAALALFLVWATDSAGYPVTHWAPGGLLVLALLGLTLVIVRGRVADVRRPVKIGLVALAAYTALSFLSILWAAVPGDAWEGANRTLLYLMVFALFACWPQRGVSAALLLGAWVLGMIALAAFAALHVNAAGAHALQTLLPGGRLVYPSGYPNANAAQFLMAFWPALLLARSERLPWALRGVFAGGAVLLAEVGLMSQSRGSLYATPVMLILVFALIGARTRTFALLVPVAAGIAAAAPAVLHVGDRLAGGAVVASTVHTAVTATFVAAAIVGLVVALGSAIESRRSFSEASLARIQRAVAAVAIAALVAVLAGGLVAAGNPVTRVRSAWHSFKGGYGANSSTGNRLVSGLGSNRYDFYRVALDQFVAHPIVGIGADNYQQQYLLHGRSDETPRYPHSVELRALSETGLLGALLLLVAIGAALAGTAAALRRSDPLARTVAAAALAGFAYWLVHGSIDWFWEFAGLGAPAFALLGLACALAPTARPALADGQVRGGPRGPGARRALGAFALLVGLAISASLAAPWLSQLEVQDAAHIWTRAPRAAYSRLSEAADLNPLSDAPYLVAGSIALRYGELKRADHEFSLALGRTPDDAYATLERGAIASYKGERVAALGLLQRAVNLDPRDPLAGQALALVRRGGRVDIVQLNRAILLKAQQLA
jgi:tetratricopeptide (TPR) repeat protein